MGIKMTKENKEKVLITVFGILTILSTMAQILKVEAVPPYIPLILLCQWSMYMQLSEKQDKEN